MKEQHILIQKLDQFIRRYYSNQLMRGALLTVGVLTISYLMIIILENLVRFNSGVRTTLFYLYLFIAVTAFAVWILLPLARLLKIGKTLTHEKAARIIGKYFAEIEDKLLNALQLIQRQEKENIDTGLLVASIDQKIKNLRVFRFKRVINYRKNLKYLKLAIPPVFLIVLALLLSPRLISEPTKRIIEYENPFEKPLPFHVTIENKTLKAFQQDDFELYVKITGDPIPDEFYIDTDGIQYKMHKQRTDKFSYLFRSLQKDIQFRIQSNGYESPVYTLNVLPRPTILNFNVVLDYPDYIKRENQSIENTGDLSVPVGTELKWIFYTKDVDLLRMNVGGKAIELQKEGLNIFSHHYRCLENTTYSVKPENRFSNGDNDSLSYRIIAIEDRYPSILTNLDLDSLVPSRMFFDGSIKDDYGFSKMEFHYEISGREDSILRKENVKDVEIQYDRKEQLFFYAIDKEVFLLEPGERITFFFEVWDNDGINGPKSARTEIRELEMPTIDEIQKNTDKSEEEIKSELEKSIEESKSLDEAVEDLSKKLLEKDQLTWEEKQKVEELLKRNEKILESIEKVKKENRKNIRNEEEYLNTSQNILEKQKRLNELMEEMMTDEMREIIEEMKKLMEQVDKDKLAEMMEKIKFSTEEMEEQLDRTLELFKQIEYERKLEEQIAELKKEAKKQEELADKIEQEKKISEQDKNLQESLKENFDTIREKLNELEKMEKELFQPPGIEKTDQKQDSIQEMMKNANEEMDEGKQKQAVGKQRKASKQMEELADELSKMMMESEMDQYVEDIKQIRQILENLIQVSFEQEVLLGNTKTVNRNDPRFQEIITDQNELNDKLQSAKDSLQAIARRQLMIQAIITREINSINTNVDEIVEFLTARNISLALAKQQFTMTSINNLALLLNEAMEQMNRNMNQNRKGKGSKMCQNPSSGKGKKSMKEIRKMQQQMSEQLKKMKKGLEEQMKNSGKKKKGGEKNINEQIARMAAQQEAIRNEMRRYQQFLKEQGLKNSGENEAIGEMEKNERDLINKMITRETLLRQQRILTRLLESEKAEQIREREEKREADEAKNQKYSNPDRILEYNKYLQGETGIIKYSTLPVTRFYRSKANQYMIQIVK